MGKNAGRMPDVDTLNSTNRNKSHDYQNETKTKHQLSLKIHNSTKLTSLKSANKCTKKKKRAMLKNEI